MSEELQHRPSAQPAAPTRPMAAAIDLYALVRSLPADGHMSPEDMQALTDWAATYADAPLPSRDYLWDIIANALARGVMPSEDRSWLYFAVDPALPRQLRRVVQRQRLLSEVRDARLNDLPCETVSFDFLLVGGHLAGFRERILSKVAVRDPVHFVHDSSDPADRIRVLLQGGECIGLVPLDDSPSIAHELEVAGSGEGVVKKVLTDGLFPIPVIGTHVTYAPTVQDVPVAIEAWQEPHERPMNGHPAPKSPLSALTRALGAKLKPVTNLFR